MYKGYLKSNPVVLKPRYRVDQLVRISKFKQLFTKGYEATYSKELFKIVKVNHTNPITYLLEDLSGDPIQGIFYSEELTSAE